jgi:phosphate:Na+ symporter
MIASLDWTQIAFQSFGGLGLFLMGMKFMSEGMQKAAGDRLRKTLNFLTSKRLMAIAVGFAVTAFIQSSSATTVMVVGFVNAALMNLTQAIGVILGANIGTTATGWIITLKIVKFSFPLIGLGVFIRFFSKTEKWRIYGEVIFGFGLLFLGMQTMKAGFAPLRESESFISFFTKVNGSGIFPILLGVFIGAITTLIVQSSSATIGITIALASQGLLNFEGAVSLILGENIGTTITANLASIGSDFNARRAAIAHSLFNVLGVGVILILFIPFTGIVESIVPGLADTSIKTIEQSAQLGGAIGTKPFIGRHIAMAHTLFNVTNVIVFALLVPILVKICTKIVPAPKTEIENRAVHFSHIDFSMIKTPALGIAETEKELIVMAKLIANSTDMVSKILNSKAEQKDLCDDILAAEKKIDEFQKYITEFLVSLSSSSLSENDANHVANYMTLSHNLENYADHLEHIALIYDKVNRKNLYLSDDARRHILEIFTAISDFFNNSFSALTEEVDLSQLMDKSQIINRRIKKLIKEAKLEHFVRLGKKIYKNDAAIQYMDLLNYLDGMRSQAYNTAEITTGTKYHYN